MKITGIVQSINRYLYDDNDARNEKKSVWNTATIQLDTRSAIHLGDGRLGVSAKETDFKFEIGQRITVTVEASQD